MKILAFSDIHSDERSLREIKKKSEKENIDLLVCSGDISTFGFFLDNSIKFLNVKKPLLIIPGNHETPELIEKLEKKYNFLKNIHGKTFLFKDYLFFGCGGSSYSPFSTPFELSEAEFKKILSNFNKCKEYNEKKFKKLIFISHDPPNNTKLDVIEKEHSGSKEIKNFILHHKPDLVICGHLHENFGKQDKVGKTIIINPGNGKIIEL